MTNKNDKFKLPLIQRIVLILAGMSNFLMGYAIYLTIKDDKEKQEQATLINTGASFAVAIAILYGILFGVNKLVKLFI